jgi:hypothetical protein
MLSSGAAAPPAAASRAVSPVSAKAAPSSSSARARASRLNGARSRGPKTPEGKARASQNTLRHGFCSKKFLLLPDDSRAQFAALERALLDDLAPQGALQTLLAHRLIAAAWRLARADRLEFDLFSRYDALDGGAGLALIRDGHSARVFPTLVRYRGAAQAELLRTLKTLKALQAEGARNDTASDTLVEKTLGLVLMPQLTAEASAAVADPCLSVVRETQDEPERQAPARKSDAQATRNEPERHASGQQCDTHAARNEPTIEQTPVPERAAVLRSSSREDRVTSIAAETDRVSLPSGRTRSSAGHRSAKEGGNESSPERD